MAGAGLDHTSIGAKAGMALTFPALIVLALTMLYPIGRTMWLSFNSDKTALRGGIDFVGLANYLKIVRNPDFEAALAQTLSFLAASFALEAVLGLAVALALHRGLAGATSFRAIVSLPLMVAPVAGALAWRFMFADGYGLIDTIAGYFGGHGPQWFANVSLPRTAVLIANL
jgi:multiple sugar transport system permease protein